MQRDERARRVSGEAKDESLGTSVSLDRFEGNGGECSRFAGLHCKSAEMDGSAERALDGGFEEVKLAHGDATCGYNNVTAPESGAEGGF